MPDHFREPTRTMGPRSPGSDHSHPLSLVVKSGDEANNLVHKKKTVENKLGSSRSPQQHSTTNPISNSAGNSDTTSGFSSDASGGGENRTSPISICPPANRQSCSNEIEQPQDFSVERFIEDSTSGVNRDRHSFQAERERQNEIEWIDRKHKYELKRDVDDNSPLPLIVSRKRSNDVVEINERSTGYSKNNSGYASPNDDSGHDGEIEDNLDTSGSSSPVRHTAERYLSNSQKSSQKREEFRAKELVIPEVVLERKVDHLISTQGISPPTENESNKRNNIHPNVTIEKVVSKENDPEHGYSSNGDATSNESEKSEEEPKHHIKVKSGIKIKEFARFDTDVVDAAEMERQLLGPNTKYEQTLAALTGLPRRSIIPPAYTIRREGLANDDNARVKCADIENTSKPTVDERHKLVEEDIDIRSEISSIDTWMSGASCHSYATKHGDNIFYEDHIMRARMSQGNYRCTYCDKMFTNSYHLTSHLVTHTGERSFSCPKCEKSFGRRSTLRAHMTTHSKTSNFMCPVCEKACNDNNSLEEHIRMHTGEKPFICTVCNKAYARKSHLSVHYRVHTGERPFVCADCGKDFTEKRFLNDHMQTSHSGVEGGNDSGPLKCPNCYREFAYKTSLKQHLKKQMCVRNLARGGGNTNFQGSHTKQFACPFCDKSYSWKQTLKQHVSMYHRNKVHTDEFWKYEMAKHRRTVVDDRDRNDDMWQQQLGRYGKDVFGKPSPNDQAYGPEQPQQNKTDPCHDERWLQQINRATSVDSNNKSQLPTEMKVLALQSLQSSLSSFSSICTNRTSNTEESNTDSYHQHKVSLQQIYKKGIKKDCEDETVPEHFAKSPSPDHGPKELRVPQAPSIYPQHQDDNYLSLLAHLSAQRKACEEEKQGVLEKNLLQLKNSSLQNSSPTTPFKKDIKIQIEGNGSLVSKEKLNNEVIEHSQKSESLSSQQQPHYNWSPTSFAQDMTRDQRSLSKSPPTLALPDIKEESSVTRTKMWLAQLGQYRQKAVQDEMEKNHDELWEEQISRVKHNPVKSPIEPLEITIEDEANNSIMYGQKKNLSSHKSYDISKFSTDESSMSTENSSSISTSSLFLSKKGKMAPLISALQVQQQTTPNRAFKMISENSNLPRKNYDNPLPQQPQNILCKKIPLTSHTTAAATDSLRNDKPSPSPEMRWNKVTPPPPPVSPMLPKTPYTDVKQQLHFGNVLNINTSTIVNVNGQNIKMGNANKIDNQEGKERLLSLKSYNHGRMSVSIPTESNNNDPLQQQAPEAPSIPEQPHTQARHIPLAIPPLQPTSHLPPMPKYKQEKRVDRNRQRDEVNFKELETVDINTKETKPKYPPPDPSTFGSSSVLKMLLLDPTKRKRPPTPPANPIPNKRSSPSNKAVDLQQNEPMYSGSSRESPNLFNRFSGAPNTSDETDILRRRLLGIKDSSTPPATPSKSVQMLLPKPRYSPPSATITSADAAAKKEATLHKKSPILAVEEFTKVAAAAATLASFNLTRDYDKHKGDQHAQSVKMTKKMSLPIEVNYGPLLYHHQDNSKPMSKPRKQQLLSTQQHLDSMLFEDDLSTSPEKEKLDDYNHLNRNKGQKHCNKEHVNEERISDKKYPYSKGHDTNNIDHQKVPSKHAPEVNTTSAYSKTSVSKHLLYRYTTHNNNNNNNNNNHLVAHEGNVVNVNDRTNNNNNNNNVMN